MGSEALETREKDIQDHGGSVMWSNGDFDWTTHGDVEMTLILRKHLVEHMLFEVTRPITVVGVHIYPIVEGFACHIDYTVVE